MARLHMGMVTDGRCTYPGNAVQAEGSKRGFVTTTAAVGGKNTDKYITLMALHRICLRSAEERFWNTFACHHVTNRKKRTLSDAGYSDKKLWIFRVPRS